MPPKRKPSKNLSKPKQPRKKKRKSHLSRARVIGTSEAEDDVDAETDGLVDHTKNFSPNSVVHLTWGMPVNSQVQAIQRHRRAVRPRKRGQAGLEREASEPASAFPNSPDRSPLLRIPLETREIIYRKLLIYPSPILMHSDWQSVQSNSPVSHAILETCKQLAEEGASFLYRNNVFQAIVRRERRWEPDGLIDQRWLSSFRNVVVDCDRNEWSEDSLKQTAKCISVLVETEACLESLTIIVQPQKVGVTETALGLQSTAITFADFFWKGSSIMSLIPRLQCKRFNIIVKLPERKRVLISVNNEHLDAKSTQHKVLELRAKKEKQKKDEAGETKNATSIGELSVAVGKSGETSKSGIVSDGIKSLHFLARDPVARVMRKVLRNEAMNNLRNLKDVFEEVFVNYEKAIEERKCSLLHEGEINYQFNH